MKKVRGTLVAASVLLVLAGFFKFAMLGYSFLSLCLAGCAALTLCYMGLDLLSAKHPKVARRLKTVLTSALALGAIALAATETVIVAQRLNARASGKPENYAVVLGAGVNGTAPSRALRTRLEAAQRFAGENPQAVLILSGGKGPGEDISESRCMFDWLTAHGVAPERLIMEDRSTNTVENLIFSREKLRELGAEGENVTVITGGYHIARARLMAADLGYPSTTARPAYSGYPVLELNYYLREAPAIWWYMMTR